MLEDLVAVAVLLVVAVVTVVVAVVNSVRAGCGCAGCGRGGSGPWFPILVAPCRGLLMCRQIMGGTQRTEFGVRNLRLIR